MVGSVGAVLGGSCFGGGLGVFAVREVPSAVVELWSVLGGLRSVCGAMVGWEYFFSLWVM